MSGTPDPPGSVLTVLITNVVLTGYTGTEVVVRDLAQELKRQGHRPLVFSPRLGPIARELGESGIEVVYSLDALTAAPDIIHGHHHRPLVEALLCFPSVPAVWVCHGAAHRFDEPFFFPRILRYVAVDDRCRKRIERASDIPVSRIEVIWNAVDLARFQPRESLPAKPRRAAVFSHQAAQLPVVRRAARAMGLELDIVGTGTGGAVSHPESVLANYDIVFAKARCAIEAMAVGSAVVLCDAGGAGPMVTSAAFDSLRSMNFGGGVLTSPLRPEHLIQEIRRYDPADAAVVSRRIRNESSLADTTRRWIDLYRTALDEFRGMNRAPAEESRALAAYLRKWHYDSRIEWEHEQLDAVRRIPVIGGLLVRSARRLVSWWMSP